MSDRNASTFTRRAFLAGGAAALGSLFLPQVPGTEDTFLAPLYPETAWADELTGASGTIVVVGRSQVGIAVGDIGTLDPELQTIRALSDATVTLHSFYNGREVAGTTDETGKVVLDIADLAEEESGDTPEQTDAAGKKLEYCFNGSITVRREGYRDVVIGRMRIRSVSAIIAPTHTLDTSEAYLRQLSFDQWDLQYSKATFMVSSENNKEHTIAAEAWVPAGKKATLDLYYTVADDSTRATKTSIGQATLSGGRNGDFASASFSEHFLDPNYPNKVLPAGCTLHAALTLDGATTDITAGLQVLEAPFTDDTTGAVAITPEDKYPLDEDLSIVTIPDTLPAPLGGSRFSIWKPSFENVIFDFSPLGYVMFGFKLGSLSMANDGGVLDRESWKDQPRESASKQFNRLCEEQQQAIDSVREMTKATGDDGRTKSFNYDCSSDIKLHGAFQVFGELQYDWDSSEWLGNLSVALGAALEASWTIQMTIVVVPVYISFDLRAAVTAGLRLAMRTYGPSVNKLIENAAFDADATNSSVTLNITIGLTLGVGVADVLCAYVRGAGYISTCVAFYQGDPNVPVPRLTVGMGLEAAIGVQILLFKWYGTLWSEDWPLLYDTNGDTASAAAAYAANDAMPLDANGIPSIDRMDMTIVSNDELLKTSEFDASAMAVQTLSDAEENAGPNLLDLEGPDGTTQMWTAEATVDPASADVALFANEDHYLYIGESGTGNTVPSPTDPQPGDIGIGGVSDDPFGGIKPSSDTLIFKGVFSDPRIKTINFDGNTFLFRLATVNVGGEARTRLVYSTMGSTSWGDPHVLDFNPSGASVSRASMYDYDFALTSVSTHSGKYLYVMLVTGTRPNGDDTTFIDANAQTYICLARFYNNNWGEAPLVSDTAISWAASRSSSYVSFSMPSIVSYVDEKSFDRDTNTCVMGACLVRAATKPENLLKDSASRYVMTFFAEHRAGQAIKVATSRDRLLYSGVTKLTMGPIAFNDEPQSLVRAPERHAHIGLVTARGSYVEKIVVECHDDANPQFSLSPVVGMSDALDVERLYPTGRDREFYAIRTDEQLFAEAAASGQNTSYRKDGRLYLLTFDDSGTVDYQAIGPTTCVPTELAVSKDGRYLYYLINKEGKGHQGFTETGDLDASAAQDEKDYRVMAMARVGGLFTKPFTLCSLDHPLDYVVSMTTRGATASLIASAITNQGQSKADIYDIRIPLAVCGTPLAVTTEGAFAFAGEETVFDVTVRNDGNTILSGATFNLYDAEKSNTLAASTWVDFEPDALVLANDAEPEQCYDVATLSADLAANPLAASGTYLAPGEVQTYKVTFAIPADWAGATDAGSGSGSKTVRVSLSDPRYVETEATTLALLADNDAGSDTSDNLGSSDGDFDDIDWDEFLAFLLALLIRFAIELDDCPETQIDVLGLGIPAENFADLHNAETSEDNSPIDGPETGGAGGNGGAGGRGESGNSGGGANTSDADGLARALPDTGDPGILGIISESLGMRP